MQNTQIGAAVASIGANAISVHIGGDARFTRAGPDCGESRASAGTSADPGLLPPSQAGRRAAQNSGFLLSATQPGPPLTDV
jgi:hypothetical protein